MKKLFVSMVVLIVATVSFAQNTLVATLSHGEEITMYYGAYALRDAYNAAVSGDVINLSGGAFQATNISKAVNLRGTGIDDANPTYIIGSFTINIPTEDTNRLSMEGIRCSGGITMDGTFENAYFLKCQFSGFSTSTSSAINNTLIGNCKITDGFTLAGTSSVKFINSYVYGYFGNNTNNTYSGTSIFVNCILAPGYYGARPDLIGNAHLLNSILFCSKTYDNYYRLPSTAIATNCISTGYSSVNIFDASVANTNCSYTTFSSVFKDFTGTYTDQQEFELTDNYQTATWAMGTDGTQRGLYGGMMPYSSTPSYPQITKMNVANKTTADGKLSVEIEVSAAE